jgi:hypothetical protein
MLRLHFGGPLQFKVVHGDLTLQPMQAIALSVALILLLP